MSNGNRKQRRAIEATHKPRWYKLDATIASSGVAKGLSEEMSQYVHGRIGDITIVKIPDDLPMADKVAMLASLREAIALSGQEAKVLVVPGSVSMVRLRPVDAMTAAQLDKQLMVKQAARVSAIEKLDAETAQPTAE